MPDIASALKSEISRIAKKELRAELETSKIAARQTKSQIAELRLQIGVLQKQVKQLTKLTHVPANAPAEKTTPGRRQRFSAKGFASMRARWGISAVEMGRLIGASDQSVHKWESGESVPRTKFLSAIFDLRGKGKREILALLETSVSR